MITTENDEQAEDRAGGKHGNKGQEAAQVTVEMIGLLKDLSSSGLNKSKAVAKKKSANTKSVKKASKYKK